MDWIGVSGLGLGARSYRSARSSKRLLINGSAFSAIARKVAACCFRNSSVTVIPNTNKQNTGGSLAYWRSGSSPSAAAEDHHPGYARAHPDQPFAGPHACRCGDAGMPCPECNPAPRAFSKSSCLLLPSQATASKALAKPAMCSSRPPGCVARRYQPPPALSGNGSNLILPGTFVISVGQKTEECHTRIPPK